jgi:CDP-glucose 4,6-dehydratase
MRFWKDKRVFVTGHTGFKGSWLCLWLYSLGAKVFGYALEPPTDPSLYELCGIDRLVHSTTADIRNFKPLKKALLAARPGIVIHMAAQPIVRESYKVPVDTFSTNVMGTVNILEAVRSCESVKAVVNVTTDKVYENRGRRRAYREEEPLGGYDPYSSSKAGSELVAQAYLRSYGMKVATARAGNVIGGGDWAVDRLVPDFVRAILKGGKVEIRNPKAVRPWQHVLDPLGGYLLLAERLYKHGHKYAEAWNFGPDDKNSKPVEWVVKNLCKKWGKEAECANSPHLNAGNSNSLHEAAFLTLNSAKAREKLGWRPKWDLEKAIDKIIEWTRAYSSGQGVRQVCFDQIAEYMHGR